MKDQSLRVIKTIAQKLSIVNQDGTISFKVAGEHIVGGLGTMNPTLTVPEADIDEWCGDETANDEDVLKVLKLRAKIS